MNASKSPEIVLVEVGCERPELNEPLGICTIGAYLSVRRGLAPERIALRWDRLPGHELRGGDLDRVRLVGLSAQINSLAGIRRAYAMIRSMAPQATIVIGNLLAIYAPEALLREFPDAILCTGEGEDTFALLYEALEADPKPLSRERLESIPNLAFLDQGDMCRTPSRLVDLRKLPPPRRDFASSLVRVGGITRVEASRGCHWGRCEFCSVSSRFGLGGYRHHAHERVLTDLERLAAEGARSPYFSDEDFFGARYEASGQLADRIGEAKATGRLPHSMDFFVSILTSDVKRPEGRDALLKWKAAGLREVFIGVEAGAEDEIRRFAKKANAETNRNAIAALLAMGFQVDIGFIMFDPMMTLADLEQNVAWLRRQQLDAVDSRVTKRLRIQPMTGLETRYGSLISGPLDVDELTYPNTFADPRVERIEREFRTWENISKTMVYRALGEGRGEVEGGKRIARKRQLARIRDLDLVYLQALVEGEREGCTTRDVGALSAELNARKLDLLNASPWIAVAC